MGVVQGDQSVVTVRTGEGVEPRRSFPYGISRNALLTDLLALAALLGILVAANREWIFNAFRWVDTWMYVGFFQHYDFAPMLADNKKIARLPWIILGYIVNQATSPVAAQFILHLGLLAAGAAALYLVVLRQFGRGIAIIVSAFYVTYIPGHANGGWDYNNTPSGPLYVLTYAALLNLTERLDRPLQSAIVLGLAAATLIHTNLLFVLVVPAFVLFIAVNVHDRLSGPALRQWTKQVLRGAIGSGFALTLLFGIVNAIVGRDFIFFERLIGRTALLMIEPDREKVWWRPWSDPWWHDSHDLPLNGYHMPLILIVLILIAATAVLSKITRTPAAATDKQVIGIFLVSLLAFVILQSSGHPLLQPYYMAFPLLMPTFLAFAALLSVLFAPVQRLSGWSWGAASSIATCALFAAFFVFLSAAPASWHFGRLNPYDDLLGVAPIVCTFLIVWLMLRLSKHASRWLVTAGAGLLVISLALTNGEWPSDPAYREAYSFRNSCRSRQATFSMIMQADRFLFPRVKSGNSVPLIYRSGETLAIGGCDVALAEVARPLASMGYDVVMPYWKMEAIAELPDDVIEEAARQRTMIAVVTRDDAFRDKILGRLRQRVPEWRVDGERSLGGESSGAKISVLSRLAAAQASGS